MENFKKTIEFIDKNNHRAIVDVEITHRNNYPEFTMSGRFLGSWGQCLDSVEPRTHEQQLLINLWKEYHLKDISKLPANVSFIPSFQGHLEGILKEIEKQEQQRQEQEDEKQKTEDEKLLNQMEEYGIDEDMIEACKAYLYVTSADDLRDFEESYSGQFNSDEDFARNMADELGEVPKNQWPHYCIDWEHAARELMFDYSEHNGYYFRSL